VVLLDHTSAPRDDESTPECAGCFTYEVVSNIKLSAGPFLSKHSLGAEIFDFRDLQRREELRQNPDLREDKRSQRHQCFAETLTYMFDAMSRCSLTAYATPKKVVAHLPLKK
jgi:hypothetical protein